MYKGKETYTPDENGDVTVNSVSPTMTLTTNNANVTLSCEYNKDLNKDIDKLSEELAKKPSGKVFEKIATYTVTPDEDGSLPTQIIINKDNDGNDFELSDIYCDCYIGLTDGSKGRFYIRGSNMALMGNFNVGFDATPKYWSFRCDSYGEGNGGLTTAVQYAMDSKMFPNANFYSVLGQPIPPGKTLNFKSVEFIGQVGDTKTFMEGTTITLWGVRK